MLENVVLKAREVWKIQETSRLKVETLRGVSPSLESGEMVAVMGSSGVARQHSSTAFRA